MRWFALVPDGALWAVMQRCPDAVRGVCEHAGACECSPDAAGPLWLSRGFGLPLDEALSRAQALDAKFDSYACAWSARHVPKAPSVGRVPSMLGRAAFSVVAAPPVWEVWRVCSDVLAFGDCRAALWCSCVHSDAGPLRGRVASFESEAEAVARCALVESEVVFWPRAGFDVSLVGGVRELPAGVCHVVEAVASALDDWGDDVPY